MIFNPHATLDENLAVIDNVADDLPMVIIVQEVPSFDTVYMSRRGLELLNARKEEIVGLSVAEYVRRFFNEEDAVVYVPKIREMLMNNSDEPITFFQQVRIHGKPNWVWHLISEKIMMRDSEGQPTYVLITATPVDAVTHVNAKVSRLLAENTFLRRNYANYSKLTDRERDVLRLQCLGKSSVETANELFIAASTVETHRRNIRQKLDTSSAYELSEYARAFDLI